MRRETTLAISHTTTRILAITLDDRVHGAAVSISLLGYPLLVPLCSMGAPRFHASTRPATVNLSLAAAQHPP
jgi:ABC-type transport system involved in cytochrome c biogenesis permease component